MQYQEFTDSLKADQPPSHISQHLEALWWDAKGDWDKAHHLADRVLSDLDADWIHAYLHRKEGDSFNAGYWYRRAKKPIFQGSLESEWESLVKYFISH